MFVTTIFIKICYVIYQPSYLRFQSEEPKFVPGPFIIETLECVQ